MHLRVRLFNIVALYKSLHSYKNVAMVNSRRCIWLFF